MISGRISISEKANRVYLQRYLLSKLVFRKEDFQLRDLCTLFENQLALESLAQRDDNFMKKFGKTLEVLSIKLQDLNISRGLTDRAKSGFRIKIQESLEDFILPNRNYPEAHKKLNKLYQLLPSKSPGKPLKFLPPKRRIGIGYTDKGSARNLATHGTPSWQEVAQHRGPDLNREGEESDIEKAIRESTEIIKLIRKGSRERISS